MEIFLLALAVLEALAIVALYQEHKNAIRCIRAGTELFDMAKDNWDHTEERLIERIQDLAAEREKSTATQEQLLSTILTMREQGMSGGNPHMMEEPETYDMSDTEELAEHQRRLLESEGSEEELLGQVRSGLADELPEYEEPEVT